MRAMTTMILLAGFAAPGLAQAVDCSQLRVEQPLQSTLIAPVAGELTTVYNQLGAPGGVLSQAYDESESVDQVLLRIRTESCSNLATTTPAAGAVNPDDPAAYKPRTEFDNAPWRFNMNQNGKNMTADEFTAWMKSRGVRVAKGRAPVAAVPSQVTGDAKTDLDTPTIVDPNAELIAAPVPAETSDSDTKAPTTTPSPPR